MKKASSKARKVTDKQEAELNALAGLPDDEIETSDIPEVRDWSGAKRGLFFRPVSLKDHLDAGRRKGELVQGAGTG